jgi:hypothetical protein
VCLLPESGAPGKSYGNPKARLMLGKK